MQQETRLKQLRIAPEPTGSTRRKVPFGSGKERAVFVDRDGVINKDIKYTLKKKDLELFPGVKEALIGFREMGFRIFIITNQAGIGLGKYDKDDLADIMEEIGSRIGIDQPWDMVYFSPFHEDAALEEYKMDHQDRKPGPGMILRAALEHDIDLPSSFMIGDRLKDIQAAHRSGCTGILVLTGRGNEGMTRLVDEDIQMGDERYPDDIVSDLREAMKLIRTMEEVR